MHTDDLPMDYVAKVKAVHETGGYGSIGYGQVIISSSR